ncbi:hypothetical protein MDA_GLEAN10003496 [Myotis davidii]|uniref:Uncharacterized protein n=1 Tax=Myotis davidii TaxID=225400 RepID=L5LKS2_MYODS|nr:hypothetical protein MDA_GLEAN10003496 [Myotis davidii]
MVSLLVPEPEWKRGHEMAPDAMGPSPSTRGGRGKRIAVTLLRDKTEPDMALALSPADGPRDGPRDRRWCLLVCERNELLFDFCSSVCDSPRNTTYTVFP